MSRLYVLQQVWDFFVDIIKIELYKNISVFQIPLKSLSITVLATLSNLAYQYIQISELCDSRLIADML